jgi:hypothetical protein
MKLKAWFFVVLLTLTFFSMRAFSQEQVKTYNAQWKIVDAYLLKALPQSALQEVKKIHLLAKKDKQEAQVIKATLYMIDLQNETRENPEIAAIQELEKEISESSEPAKSILNSLLANTYYRYYEGVRWKLYRRTQTVEVKKEDIGTWGTEDFHKKIGSLYLASLENETLLKQTRLEMFDAIIRKGNTRKLRPTLFDLLAFQALQYFSSDEYNVKNPSVSFEINTPSAFDPATDFIHRKFQTNDPLSFEYVALLIYQRLIAFHMNDQEPDARIDADIHRLQFVREKSVHPDADHLYLRAIHDIAQQYRSTPAAAQAWYLEARWYYEQGRTFDIRGDTTHRFEKVRAAKICEEILRMNPNTEGGINALNLAKEIKQPKLRFQVENVSVPGKPFLIKIEYANTTKISLRVVNRSEKLKKLLEGDNRDQRWQTLIQTKPLKTWEQELPDTKDHQTHTVEIKAEHLPIGEYYLLAGSGAFNDPESPVGRVPFHVSDISWVQKDSNYFVLDRDSGQPLSAARVAIWHDVYNYKTRTYKKTKGPVLVTDSNGHFQWKLNSDDDWDTNVTLDITHGKNRLFLSERLRTVYRDESEDDDESDTPDHIHLFTDRSIYRPGQILYYKGIVRRGLHILKDQNQNIETKLYDVNDQVVAKATHQVNNFGSFSGIFRIPEGLLNGEFRLESGKNSAVNIRVEEYKRPKFSVAFDSVGHSYKLGDTVRVKGTAVAYAANVIDGAKVSYRVVRQTKFIYRWLFQNRQAPYRNDTEIAHGKTVTDSSGRFSVQFIAMPDLTTDKKLEPIFDYVIEADITDGSGETRSGTVKVSVGYKSISLTTIITDRAQIDSLSQLGVRTENMNGMFVPAELTIQISSLVPEKRLIKKRFWTRPDLFVMTKTEFVRHFPNDEYNNESEWENWPVLSTVVDKKFKSSAGGRIDLSDFKFLPGYYRIVVSALDPDNNVIKDIKYVALGNPEALLAARYMQISGGDKSVEPGQNVKLSIGTSANQVFLISKTNRTSDNQNPLSIIHLNARSQDHAFVAREDDRGGFFIDFMFVKHNRIFQQSKHIQVPWSNKDLKIEYLFFRSKVKPGGSETWKIKVSGYKEETVETELVASMYDASLDQIFENSWTKPEVWPFKSSEVAWASSTNFGTTNSDLIYPERDITKPLDKRYDELMYDNVYEGIVIQGSRPKKIQMSLAVALQGKVSGLSGDPNASEAVYAVKFMEPEVKKDEGAALNNVHATGQNTPQIRKNFNETAFFFPNIQTNEKGEAEFSFTMPEALTRWKFQVLAHTRDLAMGYSSQEIVTQKDLMVLPNPPRFLREGDKIDFVSKIANLTDKELNGTATLQLMDAETNEPIDQLLKNIKQTVPFNAKAKQSSIVKFPIEVPMHFNKTLTWRIVATSGMVSDGEENLLPVLPNRVLVTETLPLTMRGPGKQSFRFDKLVHSGKSATLANRSLSIEYTANPAWQVVQALPYLMAYPYDCAEQTWNRYYANVLAAHIVKRTPGIARVFEHWRMSDTTELLSNLQRNPELKSILIEETPWVLAAKSETEQKRNIGLLFDLLRMSNEMTASLEKVKHLQTVNGGFAWFKGGPEDPYMTQYIVSGIGHLQKLNAIRPEQTNALKSILNRAIPYLDVQTRDAYDQLMASNTNMREHTPSVLMVQYLYMRSFFPDFKIASSSQKAVAYFHERIKKTWTLQNKFMQGMIAIIAHRSTDYTTAKAILKSLSESAIHHDELGMYWKSPQNGYWYENQIERQAVLIEAFQEAGDDTKTVNELRTWLLKNKQTNRWESTKATAEACYALILQGTDWLSSYPEVTVRLGNTEIRSTQEVQESQTGYFQKQIPTEEITPDMGNIQVKVASSNAGQAIATWGAVYWQYFEDLDKISTAETPLKLEKELFVEKNTNLGPVITPIGRGDILKVGDKIKVRIVLRVDRQMEYVHMKDLRASSLEPVEALSSYKWQGGLGYYESTRDASTNFFFSSLQKGTYVFEYPLFVTHTGDFSNGITTIQCMYAPEFTAHSAGIRLSIGAQ